MDIMELGAIGELVGGVAVIASLIFVGVQIRTQTQEQRLAATRDLSRQFGDALAPVVESPELASIYRQALQDLGALQEDERLRVNLALSRVIRVMEQQFLHTTHARIDPGFSEAVGSRIEEGFELPGVQEWWRLHRSGFSPRFREHVDSVIARAETKKRDSEPTGTASA